MLSFPPETDGQTEWTNQTLEQYLCYTMSYQQDDWLALLSQAKFTYNNTMHASTGISLFFTNYNFHPKFSLEILRDSVNPSTEERAKRLGQVQQDLMAELKLTQEWQKKQANRRRKDHPNFKVRDKVWLLKKNIATTHPCAKLDYKRLGPFKIAKLVGLVACQLELPPSSRSMMFSMSPCLSPIMKIRSQNIIKNPQLQLKLKVKKNLKFRRSWTLRGLVESSCTLSFGEATLLLKLLGSLLKT